MMIKETVKITVELAGGSKYAKQYTIESDGSYDHVCEEVAKIVRNEWKSFPVKKSFWNYI